MKAQMHAKTFGTKALALSACAVGAAILLGSTCNLTNKAPTVPVVSGPSAGVVGVPVTFKATATDPENDSIMFQFDWDDTGSVAWYGLVASGETVSVQHTYSDSGTFLVKAKAKDAKGKESGWCAVESVQVLVIVRDYPDSIYAEIPTPEGYCCGAITPGGSYLYVVKQSDTLRVTPIRLADRTVLPSIMLDAYPDDIVSSADGSHVYVSLTGADKVLAIRTSDNTIDYEVSVVHKPRQMAVTPDGQTLLVSVQEPSPGFVLLLRTSDLAVMDTLSIGTGPGCMVVDHAGQFAYICTYGCLHVLDLRARAVVDSLPAVLTPGPLGLSHDGQFLYANSREDTGFVVVRLADRTVVSRVYTDIVDAGAFVSTLDDKYMMFTYQHGIMYVDTRAYAVVDSIVPGGENRRDLVMHPAADTMYLFGYRKVYIIGPR
jgi:DNA-binding beta-propeller fold protein YncE